MLKFTGGVRRRYALGPRVCWLTGRKSHFHRKTTRGTKDDSDPPGWQLEQILGKPVSAVDLTP